MEKFCFGVNPLRVGLAIKLKKKNVGHKILFLALCCYYRSRVWKECLKIFIKHHNRLSSHDAQSNVKDV